MRFKDILAGDMRKYLGIDYGVKRIGVAVGDEERKIAFPKGIILNQTIAQTIKELKSLVRKEEIDAIVVGLPMSLQGRETDQTKSVRDFAQSLKKEIKLPVLFENEMLTTKIARLGGTKKEHIDKASAALILQSYLDKTH